MGAETNSVFLDPMDEGLEETILEIDRNARAHGWEIGFRQARGINISATDNVVASPENPFVDKNWRENG